MYIRFYFQNFAFKFCWLEIYVDAHKKSAGFELRQQKMLQNTSILIRFQHVTHAWDICRLPGCGECDPRRVLEAPDWCAEGIV
jgi:hypothetical protein